MHLLAFRHLVSLCSLDQSWEFALSLIRSSLFCSKSLSLKSDCERFAQVAHDKKAAISGSLSLLLAKEQPYAICSGQKSDMSKLLLLLMTKEQHEWFARDSNKSLSKMRDTLENIVKNHIIYMFWPFFPLFMPKGESLLLFLAQSLFLKSDMSDSIMSLFTWEHLWANCSGRSLQKNHRKRYAQFALLLTKTSDLLKKTMSKFPTLAWTFDMLNRRTKQSIKKRNLLPVARATRRTKMRLL